MSSRTTAAPRRWACALAASVVVVVVAPAPTAAHPRQDPSATTTTTIAPTTTSVEPGLRLLGQSTSAGPDGQFTAFVAIDGAPDATDLVVDIYDRAQAADAIGADPPEGPIATFPQVELPEPTSGDPDAPRSAAFTISLYRSGEANPDPAWGYRIDEPGVYPVRLRLREDGATVATTYTALIRDPGDDEPAPEATEAALLVEARRSPPSDDEDRRAGDVADETILSQLDPVVEALDAHPTVPATYSVTPDAIARIAADTSTTDELDALRGSLARDGHDLLDASYVDIDPATLVAAGLDGELTNQRDLGRGTLTDLLEAPLVGTWRLDHHVDENALDQLRQRGIFRVIVPSSAVHGGVLDPAQGPAGESTVRLAAASPTFTLGATAPGDPVLAAHRLLARLATVATDRTVSARVVVDVVAAIADPTTLGIVLDALAEGSPWFASTTLDALLDASSPTEAELQPADPVDLGTYPDELTGGRRELASYASMVGKEGQLIADSERTLTVSAAAGLDLDQRWGDVRQVREALAGPFDSIHLPAEDTVTLGARDATFPVTIRSELGQPADVVIELQASDRLEFPSNRIPVTLEGERTTVSIHVRTRASGDTPVLITVRSPDDQTLLAESRYVVRSTAISGVGLVLTLGAAAFLAVWWARHWLRARRARNEPSPADSPEPM